MHVPNHLLSPEVAILGGVVAAALIGVAVTKVRRDSSRENFLLAGTLGAFVFAIQMLNFAIGDIGCSGHLIGGILLAAMLGKWLGFLTLAGVLTIQTLLFADGGIMALGWNILNMAAIGTLVAYPLIFAPIVRRSTSSWRLFFASILASVVAVELGAAGVVLESGASGISSLPVGRFMGFMLPIHLIIGAVEGVVVGGILVLVAKHQPAMIELFGKRSKALSLNPKGVIAGFALSALLVGGALSLIASERPDGLEWSIGRTLQGESLATHSEIHATADSLQETIAIAPDYEGDHTGLIATAGILLFAWVGRGKKTKVRE